MLSPRAPHLARDLAPTPTLHSGVRGGEVRTSSLTRSTSFARACFVSVLGVLIPPLLAREDCREEAGPDWRS